MIYCDVVVQVKELEAALARVEELEQHIQGLQDTHAGLEVNLSQAQSNIDEMKENLKNSELTLYMNTLV